MIRFKSFLPKSLFGRALLILVLPTVLIQMVTAYVFFDRHWQNITRYMSSTLAGDTAFLVRQLQTMPPQRKTGIVLDFEMATGIDVYLDKPAELKHTNGRVEFPEFQEQLAGKITEKFVVRKSDDGNMVEIRIRLPQQILRLETSVKRLESRTTMIFFLSMVTTTTLLLFIAVLFLRNQIRPIRQLAEAADDFGRGLETPNFHPHGATEVRKAARAFIIMRERIRRQLRTRTEMLAGISHDLRTPLTRMKLQLAMFNDSEAVRELGDDVQQMEHMIQEYLDFARDEGREEPIRVSLTALLGDVVRDYERLHSNVTLASADEVEMELRISGIRRMLHNLIDNALRYGKRCTIRLRALPNACELVIDDEGPGIPADKYEEVFRPFSRLEASRNQKTGGVGLGMTIARDIVLAHGGSIHLDMSPFGGLRIVIRLPL